LTAFPSAVRITLSLVDEARGVRLHDLQLVATAVVCLLHILPLTRCRIGDVVDELEHLSGGGVESLFDGVLEKNYPYILNLRIYSPLAVLPSDFSGDWCPHGSVVDVWFKCRATILVADIETTGSSTVT
jgi:hypothetical protein